ncbi:hypothetical protein COT60_03755 [Candidatus Pacearchaeota archaeon CG09_land_8_20_14_0_10_30_9]|nr:MAG: hypothetical protein AUJ61_03590 [Candidatus Pacearchaeota archaeon CG1_02_30_18]PIN71740.1 MAG: hypothetical protein COV77_00545 [Candidatus Pacearchaeota archaeon CG11_big_fil_rev_8_21_14_0_20_30_13]PIO00823.1 MAG: hypothetical protein COT60_03755 [Candidatus Pacearchaeota archaeon CG09_land_8_20_14_0_10_30_9]PIZ81839.1 MAG: hypothetical protein COX98_02390 [Candidatus Pacearchaeota archaeon CG_4_10_14_0_2_um_filter_30_11]PJA71042.1 MAG: hypothetical protein CO153_03715 [Candidatus Pa
MKKINKFLILTWLIDFALFWILYLFMKNNLCIYIGWEVGPCIQGEIYVILFYLLFIILILILIILLVYNLNIKLKRRIKTWKETIQ